MSQAAGTVATIALELSKVLSLLEEELTQSRAKGLFVQLGIPLNTSQVNSISGTLNATINKTTAFVNAVDQLFTAINTNENDYALIASRSKDTITALITVINSFKDLADAIQALSIPGVSADTANKIPERLFNYLLATYLDNVRGTNEVLELFGILERTDFNSSSIDPENPPYTLSTYHFDQFGTLFSSPGSRLQSLYDWGAENFDGTKLLPKVERVLARVGMPVIYNPAVLPLKLDVVNFTVEPKTDVNPKGLLVKLKDPISSGVQTITTGDLKIDTKVEFAVPADASLVVQPNGNIAIQPATAGTVFGGEISFKMSAKKQDAAQSFLILGENGGSRLEVGEMAVNSINRFQWDGTKGEAKFGIEGSAKKCKIIIDASKGDGFIQKILPNVKFETTFDLTLGYSTETGFYFGGSSALEINLPLHLDLGPISLEQLTIGLKFSNGTIPVSLGVDMRAALGPIVAVVQNIGMNAVFSFPPNNSGNLGPLNLDIGFKAPNGVGLSIDAGIVKGGGFLFLDSDKGEYAGALELSIQNTIQIAAIGIINTKMPDGTEGFSLLIILSVQFTPGIVLGMGFFLNGLGGMLGIHRTISVPALREGVRNNALDSILFPEDVVANINTLLPQIRQIFPIQRDQFFIGLMAKITWGVPTLISIEFGIAVEFSNPTRIAILGVFKIVLPTEDAAILRLQVNFLGIIDFDNGYLSFDASIVNSRILAFTLEGDMALRLNWGRTKGFLMSVGGFHPSFTPPQELNVPQLRRLTLTIFSGNPNLVLTCYFAVTSNTVQFGARVDLRFEAGAFQVVGFLLFDVLFQFSPFHFEAHIGAGLAVKSGSATLFSIDLDFILAGPTPWNAKGTASFSILFITIKVRFNITWGDAQQISEPSIAVLPKALEAFSLPANWIAELPANRTNLVSLKELKADSGDITLQSYGALRVSQTIVPLNIDINKFGNNVPLDVKQLRVNAFSIGGQPFATQEVRDAFAPAAFRKLEDEEKLKAPSYAQEVSGVRGADSDTLHAVYGINRQLAYDCTISDFDPFPNELAGFVPFNMAIFKRLTRGGDIAKNALSKEYKSKAFRKEGGAVTINEEAFVIVNNSTLTQHAADAFRGGSQAEAQSVLNNMLRSNPKLRNSISVAPAYHLDTA